jgi:hypothetical protein
LCDERAGVLARKGGIVTTAIVVIVVIVIVALAVGGWLYSRQHRVQEVRQQFGPEYDRTVEEQGGDEHKAASLLRERRERVDDIEIHPLSAEDRDRFAGDWQSVQAKFVDDPSGAVNDADALIAEAMRRIGYPVDQYEQREEAVSVKYPEVAGDFRQAHEIALSNQDGNASTEDLRNAMVLYRGLFERLVGMAQPSSTEAQS